MKTISVIMPCLNAEKYIEDSLYSIFRQSDSNVELIIIDGQSKDRTLHVLKNSKFPITRIVSEKDRGASDALNKGFNMASGDILCWLNADDAYLYRHTFAEIKSKFSTGGIEFAYGHSVCMNATGEITKTLFAWPMSLVDYQKGSNIFTGSLFFSRKAWKDFGGFNLRYKVVFEYELLDHLFRNYKPHLIDRHLAALRQYSGTLSERLHSEINQERQLLRGRMTGQDLIYQTRRVLNLINEGLALEVLANKCSDRYASKNWRDVFDQTI